MDYVRYLKSKQTVDDRALNLNVLQQFESHVLTCSENLPPNSLVRVVEVGAGIGAMFLRLLRRKSLFDGGVNVEYTLVDVKRQVLEEAKDSILQEAPVLVGCKTAMFTSLSPQNLPENGSFHPNVSGRDGVHHAKTSHTGPVLLYGVQLGSRITVNLVLSDAIHFLNTKKNVFDVVIGAAVLDLWQLTSALETFRSCLNLKRGIACFYFPINFDGTTDFFPLSSEGPDFDADVETVFHSSMGRRSVCGYETLACHTGRRLLPCLSSLNINLSAVGGSTWVVSPLLDHSYQSDEQYFLSCILDFIESTLGESKQHPIEIETSALERYLQSRRKQLSEGQLVYVAHNIDAFAVL